MNVSHFLFTICQVASSNKRTFYIFLLLLTCVKQQVRTKQTNCNHPLFPKVSSPECLVKRRNQKVLSSSSYHSKTNRIVDNNLPQWNYTIPKRTQIPFSSNELGYPVVSHSSQVTFTVPHSWLHHKHFTSISYHLGSKMVYSVFKSLRPVKLKISSSSLRMKKLK